MTPILITFPPSIDCETARFLLDHYAIPNVEERHALIFSSFVTLWYGFTPVFPLLYSNSYRLAGPRSMVDHLDPQSDATRKLLPADPSELSQANSDWSLFNGTLATATAKFAYYHLLPHRDLMIRPLSEGTPTFEQACVQHAYPIFSGLLTLLLQLSSSTAQQAVAQIRTIFTAVDARLADGRKFLVNNRFTVSDLAFAVAAAPVVLPTGYGGPIPSFDQMPPEVQTVVTEMRGHPAGAFALRIYREQRVPQRDPTNSGTSSSC